MKSLSKAAFAAAAFFAATSPALADDRLFSNSVPGSATLTVNGTTVLTATATGAYRSNGVHFDTDPAYLVGTQYGKNYNNYLVFDLSGITETITSAVLGMPRFTSVYDSGIPLTFSLYKVNTPIDTLIAYHDRLTGVPIYTDLGDGRSYGSQVLAANDYATPISIDFNTLGLYVLNVTRGSSFAVGGSLNVSAVPEPATWAMMFMGFGLIGGAMRYRRRNTTAVYA